MTIVVALWLASLIQLVIAAANIVVARRLDFRGNLLRLSPIVAQVFTVHAAYIVAVILWFALLSLLFASRLASGDPVMRFLSAGLAAFWGIRLVVQLTVYDRSVRRQHRVEDVAFLLACIALTMIYALAAIQ